MEFEFRFVTKSQRARLENLQPGPLFIWRPIPRMDAELRKLILHKVPAEKRPLQERLLSGTASGADSPFFIR